MSNTLEATITNENMVTSEIKGLSKVPSQYITVTLPPLFGSFQNISNNTLVNTSAPHYRK